MSNITKTPTTVATANHLYTLISIITMASWAIFGFLVWVPMLIRMTMVTSALVFYSAITRKDFDVSANLQKATTFYADGFYHVLAAMKGEQTQNRKQPSLEISPRRFAVEIVVAICFWGILPGILLPEFGIELVGMISETTIALFTAIATLIGIMIGIFVVGAILIALEEL